MKKYSVRIKAPNKSETRYRSGRCFTKTAAILDKSEITDAMRNDPVLEIREYEEPAASPASEGPSAIESLRTDLASVLAKKDEEKDSKTKKKNNGK